MKVRLYADRAVRMYKQVCQRSNCFQCNFVFTCLMRPEGDLQRTADQKCQKS